MQNNSQPKLIPTPFADNGARQNIPNDSQIGITAGRASYVDGFPPLTRTPLAAGGVPPFGTDFNGVLNDITAALRWSQSGAGYPFNTAFNTAINGYPKGAKIPNSTLDGYWLNTIDGNTSNPEVAGAVTTGWVPAENYGVTAITGLSGSSITLTTLQASKERITLAGTLSANINLVVPAWIKRWTVVNNCSGNYTVTIKTPNGNGVSVSSGASRIVNGDGANVNFDLGSAAFLDVGNGANQIPDMSLFASIINSGNGYQKMPGGLIIQFGGATTDSTGKIDLTLPLVYPKSSYRVVACAKGSTADNAAVSTRTNHAGGFSAFTTKSSSGSPNVAGSLAFEWITIGF